MKRQLGQFMTPDSIARTVARELGSCEAVVDFAVGEGALLQAVAQRARRPVQLYGFDIDCGRLAAAAAKLANAHLREGNGLTAKLASPAGVLLGCVGNPPFVGGTESGLAWLPKAFSGLGGKLGTDRAEVQFLARALVTARVSGARVVFVMPIGFADGDVYRRIRALLMEQYQLVKAIEVSGGRAFLDTEARTVVLVIDTKSQERVETEICEMSRADATPRLILKAKLAPGARLDARYHKAILSGPVGGPQLKDLNVSIDRGVLSRKEAEELCIPAVHTTDLNRARNRRITSPMHEPTYEGILTARKGDILLPRTGSRVRWEPVMMTSGEAAITDHVFRIRAPASVRELVYQSLCHPEFSGWLQGASKGVCATVLTKRELLQMPVFAASLSSPFTRRSPMSASSQGNCGVCERPMTKASRVEAGVRYCATCYARSFKRLMCGTCGMFKRLLADKTDPQCQACARSMPCIRCRREGRPLGKITSTGPVCNSCYPYFTNALPCEICGTQSRRLSTIQTDVGYKGACPRCQRSDHRTCALCRKHRKCEEMPNGKWQCRICSELGDVSCDSCSALMPAGAGKRCQNCYWIERCERRAIQLLELLRTRRARDAFTAFAAWVPTQRDAQRAALGLAKHAEFFEILDGLGDVEWTGEFLLKNIGTAKLRKYELPVRWLQCRTNVTLSAEDKANEADLRRIYTAVGNVPEGTVARRMLDGFIKELDGRRTSGKLSERSMRLAFRPAVALLEAEDPSWMRVPTQPGLERYLSERPGQRAAVTTFLGFLKSHCGIELRLPPKTNWNSPAARKKLAKEIASLMTPPIDYGRLAKRWVLLALRYFHCLSSRDAKTVADNGTPQPSAHGLEITYEGQKYWIPAEPLTLAVQARPQN